MESSELKEYHEQLATVDAALADDPQNEELRELQSELKSLIELTEQMEQSSNASFTSQSINESISSRRSPAEIGHRGTRDDHNRTSKTKEHDRAGNHDLDKLDSVISPDDGRSDAGTNASGSTGASENNSIETSEQLHVGMLVMARWISGDRRFYPAKITSITGSKAAPVVIVKFVNYNDTTETLSIANIKQMTPAQLRQIQFDIDASKHSNGKQSHARHEDRKRHLHDEPSGKLGSGGLVAPPPPLSSAAKPLTTQSSNETGTSSVKQQQPSPPPPTPVNNDDTQEPVLKRPALSAGAVQAGTERLDKSQHNWKKFSKKGVKLGALGGRRKIGEHSIFKSPDGVTGRVGFSGSGRPMTQTHERGKHKYELNETPDE